MTRPRRHDDERTTQSRAWAASIGVHTLVIAGALVASGLTDPDAAWTVSPAAARSSASWTATWSEVHLPPEPTPDVPPPPVAGEPPEPLPNDLSTPRVDEVVPPDPEPEPLVKFVPVRVRPQPDWAARVVPREPDSARDEPDQPKPDEPVDPDRRVESDAAAFVAASPIPGHNEPPDYPFVAWRRGVEGSVVVILEVDATGTVQAAHVAVSSGSSMLDDAALQQLATWRFEPARQSGRPVPSTFRKEVVFRLVD